MHLYLHEFSDIKDAKVKEIKDLLFKNVVTDYQERTGRKIEKLGVSRNEHGKPYFTTAINMHFSISHSGKYWACLFDSDNIGLDIEHYSTRKMSDKRLNDISKRFFMEDEQAYVGGDIVKFFRIWTAKEAYMKFTGNGFSEGFTNFSVLDDSLNVYFRNVPVDPQVELTFCSERDTNLDELINI